jgi:hypothetical protein
MVPVKQAPSTAACDDVVLVKRGGPAGIAFTAPGVASPAQGAWVALVTAMLEFAFSGRAVCLTTPDEERSRWDLDLREMYVDCERRRARGYVYLCAFDPCASATTLRSVAESQDLYLGPIWLATLPRADVRRWLDLMEAMFNANASSSAAQTNEEILYSNPDGDWIYWMNPARPEATIVDELRRLAQANGWGVVSKLTT